MQLLRTLLTASAIFTAIALPTWAQNSNWKLSPETFGPIHIGMTVDKAEKASKEKLVLEPLEKDIVTENCRYANFKNDKINVGMMLNNKVIIRIELKTAHFSTTTGLKIGDPETAIAKRYTNGEKFSIEPHKYGFSEGWKTITITPKNSPNNRLVFETDGKIITSIRAGRMPEIEFVEGCA